MRLVIVVSLMGFLAGCVLGNPYQQFYTPNSGLSEDTRSQLIPSKGNPIVFRGTTREKDVDRMTSDGYVKIGTSGFIGVEESEESAIAHAKKIGADRVVLYKNFSHTENDMILITEPNNQTSYHSGSLSSGSSYQGTTTTYGTQTSYIPYTTRKYDHGATFWSKIRRGGLGITIADLTPQQKAEIGSNKGVSVLAVIKGSAAYEADIVPGDILRFIDKEQVEDTRSVGKQIKFFFGKTANLELWRNGKKIQKAVFIPLYDQ
ncbi:MAG: PDZ domain-containing protein [Rhodospirillales bacterium]|nr:PDZ domain-containing protein [Rhodospirillales bacterium]